MKYSKLKCLMLFPLALGAQPRQRSATISDVKYTVTFGALQGIERGVNVQMTFTSSGKDPVLLSLPVWTPGDYEVSNYARNVSKFAATSRGKALTWDKSTPQTWRSDNAQSLDDVMRSLYNADYKNARGFSAGEWWAAVSKAAKGASFKDFNAKYVDGRDDFAWNQWLPRAGWRMRTDTIREPRLGVSTQLDSAGLLVVLVDPAGVAGAAGIKSGDVITSIGGVATTNVAWEAWRQKYAKQEGAPLPIGLIRGGKAMAVTATVKMSVLLDRKVEPDPAANEKAKRIRDGILHGETSKSP